MPLSFLHNNLRSFLLRKLNSMKNYSRTNHYSSINHVSINNNRHHMFQTGIMIKTHFQPQLDDDVLLPSLQKLPFDHITLPHVIMSLYIAFAMRRHE